MTTINTIEDLARILRDQPTWADALRSLLLTQELQDLPARFDAFVTTQAETNRLLAQRLDAMDKGLDAMDQQFNGIQGRLSNLEGGQYERAARNKAIARCHGLLGFSNPRMTLNQDGLTSPNLTSAIEQAVRRGTVTRQRSADLYEADMVVSADDNHHAVIEASLTADDDDIRRAAERAATLADITNGSVTPAVITARLPEPQRVLANTQGVTIFIVPYP